jgi:hypothetical protein
VKEARSFLKKRTKKPFTTDLNAPRVLHHLYAAPWIKVFCFFFSKKKSFLLPALPRFP